MDRAIPRIALVGVTLTSGCNGESEDDPVVDEWRLVTRNFGGYAYAFPQTTETDDGCVVDRGYSLTLFIDGEATMYLYNDIDCPGDTGLQRTPFHEGAWSGEPTDFEFSASTVGTYHIDCEANADALTCLPVEGSEFTSTIWTRG